MLTKTLEEVIEEASKDTTKDDNANVIKEVQDDVNEASRPLETWLVREYLNDHLAEDAFMSYWNKVQ